MVKNSNQLGAQTAGANRSRQAQNDRYFGGFNPTKRPRERLLQRSFPNEFIIDNRPVQSPPELSRLWTAARYRARRFSIDNTTTEKVFEWSKDNELLTSLQGFAIAPFDQTFFQFHNVFGDVASDDGIGVEDLDVGVLISGEHMICGLGLAFDTVRIFPAHLNYRHGPEWVSDGDDLSSFVARALRMALTVIVLLHAPKGVQITEKPAHRKLVGGKQKAYAAHSVVTIDLSAKEARRVIAGGSRGPVRAHEVRGHWMHLNRVRGCSHDWRAVPVEPDRPERYACDCGTVRVWRKAHQKGDATLGYVTHEYRVTHGDHA